MSKNGTSVIVWLTIISSVAVSFWLCYLHVPFPKEETTTLFYETLDMSEAQAESLKKLGLTPKKSVRVTDSLTGTTKTIHGRFVHVTDFHPDPYYQVGSDVSRMCHKGKGSAGKYGDAILGCDSPLELVDKTIDWIDDNLKDKIDFIVWTGDNMRHDNDRMFPRTEKDIMDMNQKIADKMHERFGDLPVPSLGNNDVYPHNLFAPGPTLQTREFFKIWRPFVPQSQFHTFSNGVYFFQEVIPNQLAVLSINTLYLFQSNPLVDSCDRKKDPGHKLFLWLGVVLKEMRRRNMKVWLTGHVPPNAKNYDISCLRKYIAWSHEYRDVVIGGLYGHMNIDHFIPLDSKMAYKSLHKKFGKFGLQYEDEFETHNMANEEFEKTKELDLDDELEDDGEWEDELDLEQLYQMHNVSVYDSIANSDFHVDLASNINKENDFWTEGGIPNGKVRYMETLRQTYYADIKRKSKSGDMGERYSIVHVSASVVPTFNPGIRIWEYNITQLENATAYYREVPKWEQFFSRIDQILEQESAGPDLDHEFAAFEQKVEILKKDKTFPPKMPKDLPLGPGFERQLFTPERYVQYYLDLASVNTGEKEFDYEIEYTTDDKNYNMKDLTTAEWLKLGRKLGEPVKGKRKKTKSPKYTTKLERLWRTYLKHTFVSSDYEHKGYG